jgi:hypothetical protein
MGRAYKEEASKRSRYAGGLRYPLSPPDILPEGVPLVLMTTANYACLTL